MTQKESYQKVVELIQKWQGKDFEVTPSFNIKDELGADSVDVMEFILTVEDEFGIEISDEDIDHLATVADVVAYVDKKTKPLT
ncbi:acyl carrier protein [Streptococcus oricebi]|uniref:Acyl carrier protein n=1 Tax=Streptococcus oricebi TaxID=1547447 RepID=A0ABS5B5Z7_9STRE|nr:acyl carrier protein [Streptococcus oricebi]MBP2624271.1 acyl carrier protein [Streptococcus oricebi]